MSATVGMLPFVAVRDSMAQVLAPAGPDDPPVLVDVVDSLYPPVLMLVWADPMLDVGIGGRGSMGPCAWTAHLQVLCVGSRVEPGAGIRTCEQLVDYVVNRARDDAYSWPLGAVRPPMQFDIGNVTYLAARVTYDIPTTV